MTANKNVYRKMAARILAANGYFYRDNPSSFNISVCEISPDYSCIPSPVKPSGELDSLNADRNACRKMTAKNLASEASLVAAQLLVVKPSATSSQFSFIYIPPRFLLC